MPSTPKKDNIAPKKDSIAAPPASPPALPPSTQIEIVRPMRQSKAEAKKFAKMVERGHLPSAAAKALGLDMRELDSPEKLGDALKRLLEVWKVPPELKKEVWQAGMFKIFTENVLSRDEATKRVALEAGKVLRDDPELGIGTSPNLPTAPAVQVEVNLGALGEKIGGLTIDTVVVKDENGGNKD